MSTATSRTCFETGKVCIYGCKISDACFLRLDKSTAIDKSIAECAVDNAINHPPHYTAHPSGIECIQITEHMNFNLGNAVKYIWRDGLKSPNAIEDLKKSRWYIEREIAKLEKAAQQ